MFYSTLSLVAVLAVLSTGVQACSNLLVTPGASVEGTSMIAYAADDSDLFGQLYYWPAADHEEGDMVQIHDWDSGEYLGEIPQVSHTYNVVGNMNEHQLTIAETTFGGLAALETQKGALIDYGSLIWITLQRARNASEAVTVMTELVAEYGYASTGESFSIADPQEVWLLELIGKGNTGELGAVWVAHKIPDGYICAHANQARITQFAQDDASTVRFSSDVITFATQQGWYTGSDAAFSFSDVYDPLTFSGARFCEARVWTFFSSYVNKDFEDEYFDYVSGTNLTHRMPLYVKPTRNYYTNGNNKLSLEDVMDSFRNHYEGTWFDMTVDFGAEPFASGYRWRPLTWNVSNATYCNERAISTQQTGWNFVAEMRKWMPGTAGILWFGVDDTSNTAWVPLYSGISAIPSALGDGSQFADMMDFDITSMFFLTNMVANLAYTKWNEVGVDVRSAQDDLHAYYVKLVASLDQEILDYYSADKESEAIKAMTNFSVDAGAYAYDAWMQLYGSLFVKYMDGTVKTPGHSANPDVQETGYSQEWYDEIVEKTGDHFLVNGDHPNPHASKPLYAHIHSIPNPKSNNKHV